MYESIKEPIRVIASFGARGDARPITFDWQNRTYKIDRVNLIHTAREGRDKIFYFSVSDSLHYFKLKFNTATLGWILEEIYTT